MRTTWLRPHFCVDLHANTYIALNLEQWTCVAFNLNTSFELDASFMRYKFGIYLENTCLSLKASRGAGIHAK